MKSRKENIIIILYSFRCFLHVLVYCFHTKRHIINADVKRSLEQMNKEFGQIKGLIYLLAYKPTFRNIFYFRIGHSFLLNLICPGISSLMIGTKNIGEGLYIQNGFATVIGACSIGTNCTIYQQVTIGWNKKGGLPTILDNVSN